MSNFKNSQFIIKLYTGYLQIVDNILSSYNMYDWNAESEKNKEFTWLLRYSLSIIGVMFLRILFIYIIQNFVKEVLGHENDISAEEKTEI